MCRSGEPFQFGRRRGRGDWPRLVNAVEPERCGVELGRGGLAYEVRLEPGPAAYQADWPLAGHEPGQAHRATPCSGSPWPAPSRPLPLSRYPHFKTIRAGEIA